jgi:GTP-binding protein YchF
MRIAIIGFPGCGKTTVFQALSGTEPKAQEMSIATVRVPDERVDRLSELYQPKKTIHASVEFVDLQSGAGLQREQDLGQGFQTAIRQAHALLHVIDAFSVPELADDAVREAVETVDTELTLADMVQCEKRIERLRKEGAKTGPTQQELTLLTEVNDWLAAGKTLRTHAELASHKNLASFAFLSAKPVITVVNTIEEQPNWAANRLPEALYAQREGAWGHFIPLCAKLEAEIAELSTAEAREFLVDYGIDAPARERVIQSGYELLGLISFFTVGADEVRAWTIRRNTGAREAAGAVHTDISRGFIRAEVCDTPSVLKCGSFEEAKKNHQVRLEGRDYIVLDGDVISYRHNT